MNYEDLKNIIPANTLSIIDDMIDTLEHKNYKACFLNEAYSYYVYEILAISFVKSMRKNDKYESFISNFPEKIFKFNIQKTDNTYNPNLTKNVLFNNIIPTYEEVSMYRCLTTYDIYRNIYTHMKNAEIKNLMISSAKLINKYNENEKQKYKGQVESEIYKNLSINVINYLDAASVIMHTLLSNKKESLTISDISILALFASLFYYKDTQKEMSISHNDVILAFLKKYDISLSTIDIRDVDEEQPNPFYIKEYFSKYYENKEDETVENIVQNIFNKKISKTVYLDKLLSSKGIDTNIFINFKDKINKEYQNMIMMKKEEIVNYFYNDLSKNVINYIDFSSKIYKIILDNINNGSVNQKLVKNEDDADTLALFIASFYYNTDIKEYFLQNGITLERVLKLVNLTLDKEKLDNEKVDTSILIDRFDRFIKGGVNKSKKRKDIKINDISYNLCDRNFNKSMIMEELFYNLTENKTLNSNFLNTIKNDLEEKERKRIQSLSKEVFKDLPVDTVLFLEDVLSKYTVMKKVSVYTNEEIKLLSFILSSCKGKYSNFFSEIIDIGCIIYYLNNQINTIDFSNIENWPSCFNIETVKEEFMTYIYDLKNKDKLSKEITVIDIFDNAISKDLNSSINVRKLLKYANTDLCNIDEKYKRYEEREKEKKIIIDNSNYLKLFNESTIIYLENALKICEFLKSDNDVPSDKNLIDISLILSLYTLFDDSAMEDLLKRNNLELSKVTNILNINLQDVNKLGKKVNYLLLDNNFKEFLDKIPKDKKNINVGDIILKLLDTSEVLDFIIKELNVEKTIFRREVETGKKYEETLEIEERMNVLLQSKMENFNGDDIGSVINFGNSLVVHSNYVFDSFPEQISSDIISKSIKDIEQVVNKVYIKKEVPKSKGLLSKIFNVKKDEDNSEIEIDFNAVKELKDSIEKNIIILNDELRGYDKIRKYMEVYRKRNNEYYEKSLSIVSILKSDLEKLDPNSDKDFDEYLRKKMLLEVMNDKINRFLTANEISKQELFRINRMMANHFITINALTVAKDDLFPLIGAELAIFKGRNSEEKSLELSKNVMELFTALLSLNAESASKNIDILVSNLNYSELADRIQSDVTAVVQKIQDTSENYKFLEDKTNSKENEKVKILKK